MTSLTPFTESNALLAVIEGDLDEARRIIATMLPGERRQLISQANTLAELIRDHDAIMAARDTCDRWKRRQPGECGSVVGYIRRHGYPVGVCTRCQPLLAEVGIPVMDFPEEVVL